MAWKDPEYLQKWRTQRLQEGGCLKCPSLREDLNHKACIACRNKGNERMKARYRDNPARAARETAARRLRQKKIVFNHYNNKCACCGEHHFEFLQVDHINGGGIEHRKIINTRIYSWLINNNFPEGFRLLCSNCNWARGIYGYCPHERE